MKTTQANARMPVAADRGSIVLVLILSLATLLVLGSFLASISSQRRIIHRATLATEARNAAEGASEYATAEIYRRAASNPSFGANGDPLAGFTIPAADLAFLAPGTGNSHVVSSQIEFKGGLLSDRPTSPMLIDANDPVNFMDPDALKTLSVRAMNVFAKVQTQDPNSGSLITSYVSQHLQIREQSWFNYAIFYNMDMEFHAGTSMDIYGPVHTNTNVYLAAGGGNTLSFYSTLTAFIKTLRQTKYYGTNLGASNHTGDVQCISAAGMQAADLVLMGTNQDSNASNFKTLAQTRWKGFVQDQTFSVRPFNPPGLPAYVPEDFTTGTVELRNSAYLLIEPQLSSVTTDPDYGQKPLAAENLKFSALSGFIIQVLPPTAPPLTLPTTATPPIVAAASYQPKWKILVAQGTDPTHPISADNLPVRDPITGKPVYTTIDPFNTADEIQVTTAPSPDTRIKRLLKKRLFEAIISIPYHDGGTNAGSWGDGFSNMVAFTPPSNSWSTSATSYTSPLYSAYDRREGYIYPNSTSSNTNGLKGAMHVLQIDLAKLNALLNDTTGVWLRPDGSGNVVYDVAGSYTGVVYVQFPLAPITTSRFPPPIGTTADGDMIRPAVAGKATVGGTPGSPGYALVLMNGGSLPQLTVGASPPDGFTIATNGPVYVAGNYNADGYANTGSTTAPDSANESTALIAGDVVTVLSPGFSFRTMATSKAQASGFTEVSAAIITGLVPTQPGTANIWSGGVHNFIHFHEDWTNVTYRYRGSLAALFESEVAKQPYREGYQGYWYSPPSRELGYHQYLSQGRFPPGTPIKRTVRRMNLQDITAAQYNAGPAKPAPAN